MRFLDLTLALVLLLPATPVMLGTTLLVRWKLGSPVLFRQARGGLRGRVFEVFKFRTMTNERDMAGELLPDEDRLHPFGKWMRRFSLDELPQLLNVVRGEMGFVGPRPLLVEYLPLYSPEQARRHEVRPGITGWAQVNGRNALSWEERFKLDVWYVDNRSLFLDLKILALTVANVCRGVGISSEGEATMSRFKGKEETS